MKRLTVVFMAVAAFGLMASTAAQAGTAQKATGTIRMGLGSETNPKQAISFDVFETTPVKGNVTYTNFGLADEGSGVWVPGSSFSISFDYQGQCQGQCVHTLQVTDVKPLSTNSVSIKGTGFYNPTPTWTETFTGTITGSQITLTLDADDDGLMYTWDLTTLNGSIAPTGVISGNWTDDINRAGPFETTAGAAYEVFSFTTKPTCVNVVDSGTPKVTEFGYTIPAGAPIVDGFDLSGKAVAVRVTDNGSSGALNDTYEHNFAAPGSCLDPAGGTYTPYPITAGNLTVFS